MNNIKRLKSLITPIRKGYKPANSAILSRIEPYYGQGEPKGLYIRCIY